MKKSILSAVITGSVLGLLLSFVSVDLIQLSEQSKLSVVINGALSVLFIVGIYELVKKSLGAIK